jgi:hypothetical protein
MKITVLLFLGLVLIVQPAPLLNSSENTVFESARRCSNCHEKIYKAWNEGPHAHSWDNLVYHAARAGFIKASAGEGIQYCDGCHAPLAALTGDEHFMDPMTSEGISCDVCHTMSSPGDSMSRGLQPVGGEVKTGPTGDCPSNLHGCREDPVLETPEFCAVCHQFTTRSGVAIYTEYSEWKNSRYHEEGVGCVDCHASEGTHSLIPLEGSSGMLQRALNVYISIRQSNEAVLFVNVRNRGAGHAVPGGPPIRSILLDVRGYNESDREVYSDTTTVLSRVVEGPVSPETGLTLPWLGWAEVKDDRLYPGQSRGFAFETGRDDVVRAVVKVLYIRFSMTAEEDFFGDDDPPVMASAEARLESREKKPAGSPDDGSSQGPN